MTLVISLCSLIIIIILRMLMIHKARIKLLTSLWRSAGLTLDFEMWTEKLSFVSSFAVGLFLLFHKAGFSLSKTSSPLPSIWIRCYKSQEKYSNTKYLEVSYSIWNSFYVQKKKQIAWNMKLSLAKPNNQEKNVGKNW